LYEFVRLYKQLSKTLTSKSMSRSFVEIHDHQPGHLLSLRTVECAERIVQIQAGTGAGIHSYIRDIIYVVFSISLYFSDVYRCVLNNGLLKIICAYSSNLCVHNMIQIALSTKKFSRLDRFGSRTRQRHASTQASLFSSSHVMQKGSSNNDTLRAKQMREKYKYARRHSSMATVSPLMHCGMHGGGDDVESYSMQQKFEMFQKSVSTNALITQALQRRRFSMVSVYFFFLRMLVSM
jgi:hypothetical protein